MAIPTVPTVATLVAEGLAQARISYPTSAQTTRYQSEVMEQLKNELWLELKQSKPLMTSSYMVLVPGQSRYSCPSDFSSDMTMVVETGLTTGIATTATANTLTTPSIVGPLDIDQTLGKDLAIISGTASASVSQIIGVQNNIDGTTTLTVYPNFQATPDSTSGFMIVDSQYPIEQRHIALYDVYRTSGVDRPRYFYPAGNEAYDEFNFDVAPDNNYPYVVRMRYTVNLMTLDFNSPLMASIYQKFREYFIRGIKYQALSDNDDTTAPKSEEERQMKLQTLIRSQQYGTDLRNLAQVVRDYM